ncbi:MAG: hypothetical protein HQ483_18355 [Rhodospirillales bacterium]|nr:hypothetical protein [Rhodospirillales bacterium]
MRPIFNVRTAIDKNNLARIEITSESGITSDWFVIFTEDLEDKFGYKIARIINGPAGEEIVYLTKEDKEIVMTIENAEWLDIFPRNKKSEADIIAMYDYLKEHLGSQMEEGAPRVLDVETEESRRRRNEWSDIEWAIRAGHIEEPDYRHGRFDFAEVLALARSKRQKQ